MQCDESVHGLIAKCRGQLIGFAHCICHRSILMPQPNCYLQDLLLKWALEEPVQCGFLWKKFSVAPNKRGSTRVDWHAKSDNNEAIRRHKSFAEPSDFNFYRHDLLRAG